MSRRAFNLLGRGILALSMGALAVASTTAAQSRIEIQRTGKEIQVAWSGGVLLSAPAISGPWNVVANAASPHKLVLAAASFFRVQETYSLTVTKSGDGSGSVRSPDWIDCGTDCGEVLLSGQTVNLKALPDQGSTFAGWSGDCSGMGECQISMDRAKSVNATFSKAAAANPVVNGDFEEGPLVGWQQQPGQLIYRGAELGIVPHSGQYVARLGYDQDARRLVRIGQQITLPNTKPLFLNFALWLYSEELCDVPYYDSLTIYIAGQRVVNEDRICRGSDTGGWRRYSIGLDAVAGQSVGVVFEIYSADALTTVMLLDDISVSSQSWQ